MLQVISLLIASFLFITLGIIANNKELIYSIVGVDIVYILLVFIITL